MKNTVIITLNSEPDGMHIFNGLEMIVNSFF